MRLCINNLARVSTVARFPCFAGDLWIHNQGEDGKKTCFETGNDDVDVNLLHQMFQFSTSFSFRGFFFQVYNLLQSMYSSLSTQ